MCQVLSSSSSTSIYPSPESFGHFWVGFPYNHQHLGKKTTRREFGRRVNCPDKWSFWWFLICFGWFPFPKGSMYGIFTHIYHKNQPNVRNFASCFVSFQGLICRTSQVGVKPPHNLPIWLISNVTLRIELPCSTGNRCCSASSPEMRGSHKAMGANLSISGW